MNIRVEEAPIGRLAEVARISIAFEVKDILGVRLKEGGLGGIELHKRPVEAPWLKDYDACSDNRPAGWAAKFDTSSWGLLFAIEGREAIGAAVLAFDTPGLDMLDRRRDLAVLWDLRVAPEARGQGVGAALFGEARRWAKARGCTQLKIETQNINVGACRFYARQGCTLGAIDRFAYPDLPDEVQLLWFKDLRG